jgi:proline dehydrogenase
VLDRALALALPAVPKPVVRRVARNYIAGPELVDARRVVARLNAEGKAASIDVLGEESETREEALALVAEYLRVLEAIDADGLDANISVKLTGLGLALGRDFCRDNLSVLADAAAARVNRVEIDMEDSSTTSETLAVYRELRESGHDGLGIVLQATLKRTIDDAFALADLRPAVRVCKGIYVEPPSVAYSGYETIRFNFVKTVETLLANGSVVAIATHDELLVEEGIRLVREQRLGPGAYEFQLLLGVKPELADRLVVDGHRVRIYVPYGRRWYEYAVRRLQENPAIARSVAVGALRRLVPGR